MLSPSITIDPAPARTKIVPLKITFNEIPASAKTTDRSAITETSPRYPAISPFTKTLVPAPAASTRIVPAPVFSIAIPFAGAEPAFNVKSPPSVRNKTDPPETIPDCTASTAAVVEASKFTRSTATRTSSTTSASASTKLIPPEPVRADKTATDVLIGSFSAPDFPIPPPATNRNPSATTSK